MDGKADILAGLQKRILSLQGFRLAAFDNGVNIDLGPINAAFPHQSFPFAAVHEFITEKSEDTAATTGFVTGLLSSFMRNNGVCVWISSMRNIFPAALKAFNVEPDHVIFVDLQNQKELLWVVEEALKCGGLAAVVAEIQQLGFTESRRLQLAVEQSGVTGFIIRRYPYHINITACVSRWKISSLPSELDHNMPGVGFPRWNVELLKMRNGKTGTWQVEWSEGHFNPIRPPLIISIPAAEKRKTG